MQSKNIGKTESLLMVATGGPRRLRTSKTLALCAQRKTFLYASVAKIEEFRSESMRAANNIPLMLAYRAVIQRDCSKSQIVSAVGLGTIARLSWNRERSLPTRSELRRTSYTLVEGYIHG